MKPKKDFLDEIVSSRTKNNPAFPAMVHKARFTIRSSDPVIGPVIEKMRQFFMRKIRKAIKNGIKLKKQSFGNRKTCFCLMSYSFVTDFTKLEIPFYKKFPEIANKKSGDVDKDPYWEIIFGWDSNPKATMLLPSHFKRLGMELRKEYLKLGGK